jgi:hypothetical protein
MAARRHLTGWIIAAIAFLVTSITFGQNSGKGTVLIFLDDLHIEFRNTPRLRTGLRQATERLLAAGRPITMVSDGPSSVSIRATTETTVLLPIANRISGSGLKPSETENPTPTITAEMRRRELEAETTFQDAVRAAPLAGIVYVTEREIPPLAVSVPLVVTRPEGMDAAVAQLLSAN